jgi:hypothetical protein
VIFATATGQIVLQAEVVLSEEGVEEVLETLAPLFAEMGW